jgi:uncharacterized protein (TIGR02246 family)
MCLAVLALCLPAAVAQDSSKAAASKSSITADDSAAIKQTVANYSKALNDRDPHAAAMCFTENADFTDPAGVSGHGRKEIEEFFVKSFARRLNNARREDNVKKINFLTRRIAVVDNAWTVSGSTAADGSVVPPYPGIHALVMRKQKDGQWLIAVFHGIRFRPRD